MAAPAHPDARPGLPEHARDHARIPGGRDHPEDVNIPHRHVTDQFIDLTPGERALYDRIEEYIRRHYNTYKTSQSQQALGFIMTVYRRRLTSSFEAIRCSLRRRLDVLENGLALGELLSDDDQYDLEGSLFDIEELDESRRCSTTRSRN